MDQPLLGKVVHYYDKIGVVIVKLQKGLNVGNKIKFVRGDSDFEQTIESMQLDHAPVQEAKTGQEIAIKVNQPAKEGTLVYSA